ncbi:hypothetical protein [Methyloceanibacter methanicus]|uniref:hypothetical protein n=1 Tax=Methyloceanibacter methanicus TaxID=1774968 RepID=UPI00114CF57F|nr:hypothetical protein [Methyloceanibacter methanicus]
MKHALNGLSTIALAAAVTALSTISAVAEGPILVTNAEDSGEGSLRAALETAAKSDGLTQILVATDGDVEIDSALVYAGRAPLAIHGKGQTVKSKVDTTLFVVSEGADLTVESLNFAGPGNFSVENRGKASKGLFVDMREDQIGVVTLVLDDVKVSGVAYHGVHISDCDLADECGAGRGGKGGGSEPRSWCGSTTWRSTMSAMGISMRTACGWTSAAAATSSSMPRTPNLRMPARMVWNSTKARRAACS